MYPNTTTPDPSLQSDRLTTQESRDLLSEVWQAAENASQQSLVDFVEMVSQVLELQERSADSDAASDLACFIDRCITEIRSAMETEMPSPDQLDSLKSEAIQRWGDQWIDDSEFDIEQTGFDDNLWEESDNDDQDTDANIVAPSADDIASMLSQLNLATAQPVDEPEPNAPPPLANPTKLADAPVHAPTSNRQEIVPVAAPVAKSTPITIASLDPELKEAFLDDASSCLASMEAALLQLESDPKHAVSLNQICRELHTLKGASASVGLTELAEQLHGIEDRLHEDETAGRTPSFDSLLQNVDSIRGQITGNDRDLTDTPSQPSVPKQSDDADSHHVSPPNMSFDDGPIDDESVRVKSSQLNRLMDMLAELVMLRNRRETEVTQLQDVYHELIGSAAKMRTIGHEGHGSTSSSLQLSEVANDVIEVAQNVRECARPVAEGNVAVSQFIRQFRKELVELRRTPISGLFRRLQRVVRDAAHAESKQVRLVLVGEDAGIERSLQQRLYEPLLHIVRNCVCHGIESALDRERLGKPSAGTITLEATSGPDLFTIEIRDDGAGLDYDGIRRRGIDSGLLEANQSVTEKELAQLIFQPGFSTRQTANQVAGRGVGMDVVSATLQRMRGWLEIDSQPQQGTRIRMSFPLPSVIQHAMVFRSADQLFALPMQSVHTAGGNDSNSVSIEFSKLLDGYKPALSGPRHAIVLACGEDHSGSPGSGRQRVTLIVDEIVGPEEVVVRPLPAILKKHPFCTGATLSGMGQTVLLLDARRVVESQSRPIRSPSQTLVQNCVASDPRPPEPKSEARPRVLVVDDSISARKRVVRSLQRYTVDIVEASNGREALQLLKTQRFAAVFSDMEMPHISGMDLLAEINSRAGSDAPPVIIISSRSENEFTDRAKQLGANNYLIKPLADESLDQAIVGIESLKHLQPTPPKHSQANGENQ
ncbi:Gliding motility regulatory protein [Rubripirellula lacrimiformis]|uniref:histidine kinase n=1 Tax=Rubripirellula lacrimiformis TaxID=1930273 RepID=A0A517NJ55_9BACT|nr:response regulator [Rubripirellula lacrimiformis]QDT07171.1 Gliding motility regulatory protein [Rubripirellula lacrimiformis]